MTFFDFKKETFSLDGRIIKIQYPYRGKYEEMDKNKEYIERSNIYNREIERVQSQHHYCMVLFSREFTFQDLKETMLITAFGTSKNVLPPRVGEFKTETNTDLNDCGLSCLTKWVVNAGNIAAFSINSKDIYREDPINSPNKIKTGKLKNPHVIYKINEHINKEKIKLIFYDLIMSNKTMLNESDFDNPKYKI